MGSSLTRQTGVEAGELESYLFNVAGDRKRVWIAFPKEKSSRGADRGEGEKPDRGEAGQLDSSEGGIFSGGIIPASGWSGTLKVRLLQYTPNGVETLSAPVVTKATNGYRISPRSPIVMPGGSALLILIERE